ncbi:MAG: MopE-related protein [Myxococcota bacterium]
MRLALLALLFGCSAVVDGGVDRCATDEGCPFGQVCENQMCIVSAECDPNAPERCNGIDDDCDEIVDEGFEGTVEACNDLDDDCDGNVDEDIVVPEVCNGIDDDCDGMMDESLGDAPEVCNGVDDDCDTFIDEDIPSIPDICNEADDDCDGTIDEGVDESCNNIDDDCDGATDEGSLCADGEICDGACTLRTCETDESLACTSGFFCNTSVEPARCDELPPAACQRDTECGSGEVCFEEAGVCIDETPFGAGCSSDASCGAERFCADLALAGIGGASTCTSTCCSDADCAEGVCANGGLGVGLCVPPAMAGRPNGESCASRADCASGFCSVDRTCAPFCASDAICDTRDRCVFFAAADETTVISGCETPRGTGGSLESCRFESCEHGLCSPAGGGSFCFAPCATDVDCSAEETCALIEFTIGDPLPNRFLKVCFPRLDEDRPVGASCEDSVNCASNRCEDGLCVEPCCSSATCGSGTTCRPLRVGAQFPGFCLP